MGLIPIALQLYTVRKDCEKDLPGTLKKVADLGYVGVELAGTYGRPPQEFKAMLDAVGLKPAGSHVGLNPDDMNAVKATLDQQKIMGVDTVGIGISGKYFDTLEGVKEGAALLSKLGQAVKDNGLELVYHNHGHEFRKIGDEHAMDMVYNLAPKDLVKAQLDVYWVFDGGADPAATVARHRDRATLLHIKDGIRANKPPFTAIGSGELDMPSIIKAADPNVTRWLIVELDEFDGEMFDAVRMSYEYLVGNKLARGNK